MRIYIDNETQSLIIDFEGDTLINNSKKERDFVSIDSGTKYKVEVHNANFTSKKHYDENIKKPTLR